MEIDFICEKHGTNKLELNRYEEAKFNSRKDFSYALEDFIKNELRCSICQKESKIEALKQGLKLPPRFQKCSFENFKISVDVKKEMQAVKNYADNFEHNKEIGLCLVMLGTSGMGKTHLCAALANSLVEKAFEVRYTNVFDLLNEVKATYNKKAETSYKQAMDKFRNADLLIIDEVGAQHGTDAEKQILFEVINDRYENVRPTIIVSNFPVKTLLTKNYIDERVIDRMKENGGLVLSFKGKSYREKN